MGQVRTTIRKTLKWCAVMVLLSALCAGGYAYTLWQRSNEILCEAFRARVREIAPQWNFLVEGARLDRSHKIHVYNMQIFAGNQPPALVHFPEIIVSVDVDEFIERQRIVVEKLVLVEPEIHLRRAAGGNWNWQDLPPLKKTDRSLPEFEVQDGALKLYLEQADGTAFSRVVADKANVRFVPSGKRQFVYSGRTQVEQAGTLAVDGNWSIDAKTFALAGRMQDVTFSEDLLNVAAGSSSKLRDALARLRDNIARQDAESSATALNNPAGPKFQLVTEPARLPADSPAALEANDQSPPALATPEGAEDALSPEATAEAHSLPQLGLTGTVDVEFLFSKTQAGTAPDFQVKLDLRQGQLANALLPMPLNELAGHLEWDNHQVLVRNVFAKNGTTQLKMAADLAWNDAQPAGRLAFGLRDVVLDEGIRRRLPDRYRKIYDQLAPTGQVDVDLGFENTGDGNWQQREFQLRAKRCSCAHVKFPYRFVEVNGTLTKSGQDLNLAFQGLAGRRPITATGVVRNAGPEAETTIDLHVERLPLDEAFRAACSPPALSTLELLGLRGFADIDVHLYRPPGLGQRMQWSLGSKVSDGALDIEKFPYRLNQVVGNVSYSTTDDVWRFDHVAARHGAAELAAAGQFARRGEPGGLSLDVMLRNAAIDDQLREALRLYAPKVIEELSPTGKLHADVTIDCAPGRPPVVKVTQAELFEGSLVARRFPYLLQDVRAQFSFVRPGFFEVRSFAARHDSTTATGNAAFNFSPTGWEIQIKDLKADSVVADQPLRAALPDDLRGLVNRLNPRGPVAVSGVLILRGTENPADPVAATWDVKTQLAGNAVSLGVEVNDARGWVSTNGTVDSAGAIRMDGSLSLDSLYVRQYQFRNAHGPFHLEGDELTLGSADALLPLERTQAREIPLKDRIQAEMANGLVTLDGRVDLGSQPAYHALLTMSKGDLGEFAQRYMRSRSNIRGIVNGWADLYGAGASAQSMTGRGQVQVSPAALYELPVIAQIFDRLSFAPRDNTAFNYAFAEFDIARGLFQFKRIDLVGEALSLSGHGAAQFDPPNGQLQLDFVARLPPNQIAAAIPIFNAFVDEATRNLVGVEVLGTTNNPVARTKAVPVLTDAIRSLLEGRPPANGPLMTIPTLGPMQPQSYRPQTFAPQTTRRR